MAREYLYSHRTRARIIGALFIFAIAASVLSIILYEPVLESDNFLDAGVQNTDRILYGALLELIMAICAVGTAVMMFPYLRIEDESLALGHVAFRFFEAALIVLGAIIVLAILSLSNAYANSAAPDTTGYQVAGTVLTSFRNWTYIIGPQFMLGINTLLYSYLFFKSRIVPRAITQVGMLGALLLLAAAIVDMFDIALETSLWEGLLTPILVYQLILAMWLIWKGFDVTELFTAFTSS